VTIDDVARESGFSVATVSRAVRGLPNVSPVTRQRVLEVAAELRYRPDPNASRLAAGKTGVVAMAVPSITSWYTGQAMAGVEAVLAGAGFELSVTLISDATSRERVISEPASLAKRADALILLDLVPNITDPDPEPWFPVVVVGDRSQSVDSVSIDNEAGGQLAGEHLIALGHRRIAVIAGSVVEVATAVTAHRTAGLKRALATAGIEFEPDLVTFGNFSALGGYEAMGEILRRSEVPTAVFAFSDEMAMGAIRAAIDAGLDVPGDISVVGFDDHELAFAAGLSTVAQDPADLGAKGALLLVDRMTGYVGPQRALESAVHLQARSSTAQI
jgi:LacI family transcriptional regulator, repressor for deo operon, udp, cdd, tsx, nupC, and nupG